MGALNFDVAVVGAGPAGAAAAISAAEAGLSVVLLDENPSAGGQVYRARAPGLPPSDDPDVLAGDDLRAGLGAADVALRFGRRVWFAAPGFRLEATGPDGNESYRAERLIVAAGTHERFYAFPGWTTPGVIGLAAATILAKSQGVLPGRRVVVAGAGPLLLAVAVKILELGGEVAAIVDARPASAWAARLPRLNSRPDLLARGAAWLWRVGRGVPVFRRSAVSGVFGTQRVEAVEIVALDAASAPTERRTRVDADAVAVGQGLVPATELVRVLGAQVRYDGAAGGWIPALDTFGRASLPGLYVAGDAAAIRGAAAAAAAGEVAALAAATDAGRPIDAGRLARARAERDRAGRFGRAMAELMAPIPALAGLASPGTAVCRCEEVTRREIEDAMAMGAVDLNQLKSWTRCGMGPCQGRMCGETAAALVAGSRPLDCVAPWTARPPLRPVSIADLAGDFHYHDIPKPAPAPA